MSEKKSYSRRDFLKIVGASTGVAVAGCAQELPEKIIPYVIQPDEVVPGVATWYAASCNECPAGCGTLVRTREGRVVKVEGNPAHPVNKGGLCAVGQSAVQGLYDPDRVREPLKREVNAAFKPVTWKDAVDSVAEAISANSKSGKAVVLITSPLSGSEAALTDDFVGKVPGSRHIEYNLFSTEALDVAAEKSFGPGSRTHFDFSKADVIVGFGADYLESWLSPVEFTKGYASGRRPEGARKISKVYHFEPRLSLTAANADKWILTTPGREGAIMLALLALVLKGKVGKSLSEQAKTLALNFTAGQDVHKLLAGTGVEASVLEKIAKELVSAENSLVVAGGASTSGTQAELCALLANLLNAALGNVGTTLLVSSTAKKAGAHSKALADLIEELKAKDSKVGAVLLYDVDPSFTLPAKTGFNEALSRASLVVACSANLNMTTRVAHVVLPVSSSFESWGDAEPAPGVFNLNQPSMQPLYKTQSYGDSLIALLSSSKLNTPIDGIFNFYDYIRRRWKEKTGEVNFESRWLTYVEKGGYWSKEQTAKADAAAGEGATANSEVLPDLSTSLMPVTNGLSLLAYPTVHFRDGRTANRPWMQEVPDPITTAIWDSWVEIHPDTAHTQGLRRGDVVQVRTAQGMFEAPLYFTKHIHPNLVAVPIGQGHDGLGRFANGVGVNPLAVLDGKFLSNGQGLMVSGVQLQRAVERNELVMTQYHDSQLDRGIFRSVALSGLGKGHHKLKEAPEAENEAEDAEEEDLHALGPRREEPQMYRQQPHTQYRWGMTVDLASCTGCSACVTACYAENNIAVVGKEFAAQGREMAWLRIERYFDGPEDHPVLGFQPMMCQHCNNAPCEPVCPVYATYHGDEGLNTMVYNRCVGTRYCSNNCSYKVRRFNWFNYSWPEPLNWQLNPDVTVRSVGVMEKCTFCVQRIREVENKAKDLGRLVKDGEIQPACASSCPADAIRFGNLLDTDSQVSKDGKSPRSYKVLDAELNTQPAVNYLAKVIHG